MPTSMPTGSIIASQCQPHEVDPRQGMMVLGHADSGKGAQPICTQSTCDCVGPKHYTPTSHHRPAVYANALNKLVLHAVTIVKAAFDTITGV